MVQLGVLLNQQHAVPYLVSDAGDQSAGKMFLAALILSGIIGNLNFAFQLFLLIDNEFDWKEGKGFSSNAIDIVLSILCGCLTAAGTSMVDSRNTHFQFMIAISCQCFLWPMVGILFYCQYEKGYPRQFFVLFLRKTFDALMWLTQALIPPHSDGFRGIDFQIVQGFLGLQAICLLSIVDIVTDIVYISTTHFYSVNVRNACLAFLIFPIILSSADYFSKQPYLLEEAEKENIYSGGEPSGSDIDGDEKAKILLKPFVGFIIWLSEPLRFGLRLFKNMWFYYGNQEGGKPPLMLKVALDYFLEKWRGINKVDTTKVVIFCLITLVCAPLAFFGFFGCLLTLPFLGIGFFFAATCLNLFLFLGVQMLYLPFIRYKAFGDNCCIFLNNFSYWLCFNAMVHEKYNEIEYQIKGASFFNTMETKEKVNVMVPYTDQIKLAAFVAASFFIEMFMKSFPQMIIQISNNQLTADWSSIAIVSLVFSLAYFFNFIWSAYQRNSINQELIKKNATEQNIDLSKYSKFKAAFSFLEKKDEQQEKTLAQNFCDFLLKWCNEFATWFAKKCSEFTRCLWYNCRQLCGSRSPKLNETDVVACDTDYINLSAGIHHDISSQVTNQADMDKTNNYINLNSIARAGSFSASFSTARSKMALPTDTSYPWSQTLLSKEEALAKLEGQPDGSFVIRSSVHHGGKKVLTIILNSRHVKDIIIHSTENNTPPFFLSTDLDKHNEFATLEKLVRYFSHHPIAALNMKLVLPENTASETNDDEGTILLNMFS